MNATTLLQDVLFPRRALRPLWRHGVLLGVGALFIAALAQVRFVLPFTPVPITGQTLGVLLVAAAYGRTLGAMTTAAYALIGALGAPVFAGGSAGLAVLQGPTGGYILGFVVAAFVVGMLSERGWDRRVPTTMLAMLIGNVLIYALGVAGLLRFMSPADAWVKGVLPFVVGDVIKIGLAAVLLPVVWRWVHRPIHPADAQQSSHTR